MTNVIGSTAVNDQRARRAVKVRPATLADVPAIVGIHVADIVTWKRWDAAGLATLADYAELAPHERWLNGGPWLDPGTYASFLERLLRPDSGGVALVAEVEGQVRAVAEAWLSDEPPPYGRSLDVGVLYALRGHTGQGLGSALMQRLEQVARERGCETMTVTHAEAPSFYERHGFQPQETWRRVRLSAERHNTLYSAEPSELGGYAAPGGASGWAMPFGRYQSARQEWERARPEAQPAFEAWRDLRQESYRLTVRGRPAVLVLDEQPRERGVADVHLWTATPAVPRQLIAAVRDRAAQSGFSTLLFFAAERLLPALPPGWHDDGYRQHLFLKALG